MPKLTALEIAEQANPGLWLETRTKIKGVTGQPTRMRLNVLQRRIIALWMSRRRRQKACRAIGLKPRKRGFSTAVSAIHYRELQARTIEGVIVGNKSETSGTVYDMIRCISEHDELTKLGRWGSSPVFGADKAKFPHGSLLTQSSALGGGSIRGQTPQFVHGTEVSFWEDQAATLLALLNAVPDDPSTTIFLESTPNGTGDEFHKNWGRARWPTPDECPDAREYWRYFEPECPDQPSDGIQDFMFVRVFAAWFEFEEAAIRLTEPEKTQIRTTLDSREWFSGEKDLIHRYGNELNGHQRLGIEVESFDIWEQLAWRRMIISTKCGNDPKMFNQEFPQDPDSCFNASGSKYFDRDSIKYFQQRCRETNWDHGQLDLAESGRAIWRPCEREMAVFMRCEQPRVGFQYLMSIDSAEGDDQAGGKDPDLHSALIIRRAAWDTNRLFHRERVVCRIKPPSRVPIEILVRMIQLLSRYWGNIPAIIEMNNTGLAVLKLCQERNVPLWKRVDINPRSGRREEKLGWRTTDNQDYGGLRSLILAKLREKLTGLPNAEGGTDYAIDICDEHIVYELSQFGEKNGRLQGLNCHDDDVLALAIGSYNIDGATAYDEAAIPRLPPSDLHGLYGGENDIGLAMRS